MSQSCINPGILSLINQKSNAFQLHRKGLISLIEKSSMKKKNNQFYLQLQMTVLETDFHQIQIQSVENLVEFKKCTSIISKEKHPYSQPIY